MATDENGWREYSKHVLAELERLTSSNEAMRQELHDFKVEISLQLAKKSEVDALRNELNEQKLLRAEQLAEVRAELTKQITDLQSVHASALSNINRSHSVDLAEVKSDLKNKAGIWGAIAGMVPVVIGLMMMGLRAFLG